MPTRRNRWYLAALFFIAIIVVAGLCFWYISSSGEKKTEKITIAQAGDFFLYAPLYIAIDADLFSKRGLEVSLVSTGGDEKTWAAVISGSASFGVADPTFVAISAKRGQPGKVIASIVNGVPFWGVTNSKTITINRAQDLAGHSVATFPSPSTAFTLQKKMFVKAGLPPQIREGSFGTLLSMLNAGQVDIALELEPNVSQAVLKGSRIVYSMREEYGDFAITGLTANPQLLSEKPELAKNVVCGLQMALDFIRANPDQALAFLKQRFPEVQPQVAKNALQRVLAEDIIPKTTALDSNSWAKAISLREEVGDIKDPAGFSAYVDNSFATWAIANCRLEGHK